jgi:hypothetical protein
MEKLELIKSLQKKIGTHMNPKLKSFKICQTEEDLFIELQTNLSAPLIKKSIHYSNLLANTDFGRIEEMTFITTKNEITDNAKTLIEMSVFQLLLDFPELFKSRFRNTVLKKVKEKRNTIIN